MAAMTASVVWEKQQQAYLYAVGAVLLWATVASIFKITLRSMDYLQLLLYSSAVSVISLFLVLWTQKKLWVLTTYTKKEYVTSLLLGILNPFLYYLVLFKSYSLLPAQQAQPLNYTWPLMVVIFSLFLLHQGITTKSIVALFISFTGVLIISTRGTTQGFSLHDIPGISLALGSAVLWAIFWIYNLKDTRDIVPKIFLNFLFGFLVILAITPWFSPLGFPGMWGLIGTIYIGVFEMGITFVLWLKALSLSKTTAQASNLIYVSPFLSLIFIHFLVGETILVSTIIGLVFIVSGIIMQHYVSFQEKGGVMSSG